MWRRQAKQIPSKFARCHDKFKNLAFECRKLTINKRIRLTVYPCEQAARRLVAAEFEARTTRRPENLAFSLSKALMVRSETALGSLP